MIQFNPENKEILTYGEALGPAMLITDEAEAQQYFADYAAFIQRYLDKEPRADGKTGADIARINLGYYAGYYDHATRLRVEKLFMCRHPLLGKAQEKILASTTEWAKGVLYERRGE